MSAEDSPPDGFEAVRAGAKTVFGRADKITYEILVGWYPQLTDKEFVVCNHIIWTIHDLNFNEWNEIIARIVGDEDKRETKLFKGEQDIIGTIIDLIAKGIVAPKQEVSRFGIENPRFETSRLLYLKEEVENEIFQEISGDNSEHFPSRA